MGDGAALRSAYRDDDDLVQDAVGVGDIQPQRPVRPQRRLRPPLRVCPARPCRALLDERLVQQRGQEVEPVDHPGPCRVRVLGRDPADPVQGPYVRAPAAGCLAQGEALAGEPGPHGADLVVVESGMVAQTVVPPRSLGRHP